MERMTIPESVALGVFDIDGTVKEESNIPEEILSGFSYLHALGIGTTFMTGRGYSRFLSVMGKHVEQLVSQNVPLGLENGGRITDPRGNTLRRFPLSLSEIEGAMDHIQHHLPEFVLYYPINSREKAIMWSPRTDLYEDLVKRYSDSVSFDRDPLEIFRRSLIDVRPSVLVIKPGDEEAFPSGLNTVAYEGVVTVNADGISKASGVREISDLLDIGVEHFLLAGNDNNDREMLNLPAGLKILIGDKMTGNTEFDGNFIRITSPTELGRQLGSALISEAV